MYSDLAIELALTLRTVYHLPLRSTQGFLSSVFKLIGVELDIPDYTTLSRRASKLKVSIKRIPTEGPIHLAIDSTGLKVFGEGEWKVRMHGFGKRRTWRKLHIGVDIGRREIVASEISKSNVNDCSVVGKLIPSSEKKVAVIYADGAYDNYHGYEVAAKLDALPLIDPRSGAALATGNKVTPGELLSDVID